MRIDLNPDEETLATTLRDTLTQIRTALASHEGPLARDLLPTLADAGHRLHLSLQARGIEPRHHKYIVENRELAPTHPDFYKHVHSAQDLVKFIEDDEANRDPEDTTIGVKFTMVVMSPRWEHEDTYSLTRTKDGWYFEFMSHGGDCDREGKPHLYGSLGHDSIPYPSGLPDALDTVWRRAKNGATRDEVQAAISALGAWVTAVVNADPRKGLFAGSNA